MNNPIFSNSSNITALEKKRVDSYILGRGLGTGEPSLQLCICLQWSVHKSPFFIYMAQYNYFFIFLVYLRSTLRFLEEWGKKKKKEMALFTL